MFAYDYPILGIFWSTLIIFMWIAWLMLLFNIYRDIFRSDMEGFAKALWALLVFVLPLIGALLYVLIHGNKMTERNFAAAQASEQAVQSYIRSAAGTSTADQLAKLADLKVHGHLTDAEFEQQKARLLA